MKSSQCRPPWNHKFVLLKGDFDRRIYFIDSRDAGGFLTRFIPVVEHGSPSRTDFIENAGADLRLLNETPSTTEARIIERVVSKIDVAPYWKGVPGVRIEASGSAGTFVAITDEQGIYDMHVPPGSYTILPRTEPRHLVVQSPPCSAQPHKVDVGDAVGCRFIVE